MKRIAPKIQDAQVMESNPPIELMEFLSRYPGEVVELFLATREKIVDLAPEGTEIITNVSYTVASGITFTHSIKQAFLYIGAYSRHVNIGFVFGSSLSDPNGLLKGDGKQMRHVSIRTHDDLTDARLSELLKDAILAAPRPEDPLAPKTVITKNKK